MYMDIWIYRYIGMYIICIIYVKQYVQYATYYFKILNLF
jgi:hypothetical protein